jgi:hypothetical protein
MKNLFLVFLLLFIQISFAQVIHTVDNSPNSGADFDNVQTAINAAAAGDTIYIHPSPESYGNITVNKLLHFRSLGHSTQYTNGMSAQVGNIVLNSVIAAQGITISGLRFGNLSASSNQNYDNLVISNCYFTKITASTTNNACNNWVITGSVLVSDNFDSINKINSNGWIVTNNHLSQPNSNATWSILRRFNASDIFRNNIIVTSQNTSNATVFNDCQNFLIENCIIIFMDDSPGFNFTGNSITFNNCLTYHNPGLVLPDLNGSNNLNNTDPMFVNIGASNNPAFSINKDFNIQEGSPASGYGTDGQDLGLYGNSFPFNIHGYPADLPFITSLQILNNVVEVGGTLNVNIEANGN